MRHPVSTLSSGAVSLSQHLFLELLRHITVSTPVLTISTPVLTSHTPCFDCVVCRELFGRISTGFDLSGTSSARIATSQAHISLRKVKNDLNRALWGHLSRPAGSRYKPLRAVTVSTPVQTCLNTCFCVPTVGVSTPVLCLNTCYLRRFGVSTLNRHPWTAQWCVH